MTPSNESTLIYRTMFTWIEQQVALDSAILHDKCFYSSRVATWSSEGEEWKKRQIAEISSIAMPLLLRFHARIAHSTKRLDESVLSGVEDTISTASWLEITSHTYNNIIALTHAKTISNSFS